MPSSSKAVLQPVVAQNFKHTHFVVFFLQLVSVFTKFMLRMKLQTSCCWNALRHDISGEQSDSVYSIYNLSIHLCRKRIINKSFVAAAEDNEKDYGDEEEAEDEGDYDEEEEEDNGDYDEEEDEDD